MASGFTIGEVGNQEIGSIPCSEDGKTVLGMAPLMSDVTFVHALAADAAGNAVTCPPVYNDEWAAFAARSVIVTTDHIVDTAPEMPRREEFLEAALTRFAELGYSATSTREICADIGLVHPAIYNYFSS